MRHARTLISLTLGFAVETAVMAQSIGAQVGTTQEMALAAQQVASAPSAVDERKCVVPARNVRIFQYDNRGFKEAEIQIYKTQRGWFSSVSEDWPAEYFLSKTLGIPCDKFDFKVGDKWNGRTFLQTFWESRVKPMGNLKSPDMKR